MKLLSVILPVYNVAPYLEGCVHSLLSQTYAALEVLLIDDGSTDSSGALCDALAQRDSRVRVFHKENGGVSTARNLGLDRARGEYIGFVDPDDRVEPEMFADLIAAMEGDGTDAAFCGYWEDPEQPSAYEQPILHSPAAQGTVAGSEALYQCLIGMGYGYFTAVWNKVFRRDAIAGPDGSLPRFEPGCAIAEDELWLTQVVPGLQGVSLLPKPYYHWLQRTSSALHARLNAARWRTALWAKERACALVRDDPRCGELALGKVYNDVFHVTCLAYCEGEQAVRQEFLTRLRPYKTPFLRSNEFSKAKKGRYLVLEWMMLLHLPKTWVAKLEQTTSVKLRQRRTKTDKGEKDCAV